MNENRMTIDGVNYVAVLSPGGVCRGCDFHGRTPVHNCGSNKISCTKSGRQDRKQIIWIKENTMEKQNLEDRMVVEYRDGNRRLVCGDYFIGESGGVGIGYFNDALRCKRDPDMDIVKVYNKIQILSELTSDDLTLLWQRGETHTVLFDGGEPVEISAESFQNLKREFTK